MSWKKHFSPVKDSADSSLLTNKSSTSKPGPARTNYSSYLPDIYTGSPNRVERYSQYEVMDSDPEVNAALDILAEFCTQKLKDGKSPFNIKWRHKATNTEVRILGEYLQQWNKLQLFDTRIFRIVRNVFKYGDGFFIRDPETQKWNWLDPTKIIKILVNESDGKKPTQYVIKDLAPNFENLVVTQITPNVNPRQNSGSKVGAQSGTFGAYPTSSSGSKWGLGETEYAIDAEHVIHLSLSEGLDNNYPFGNSLLENVFKVYKQKELLEDAILIYRIQRAPERRVFHIDVGNMPSHLAMAFVERVKNEIHQRRIPSQTGGGCFVMTTKVPLLDGRTISIAELADEYRQGKENWAYSCDPETREMVPGIITWAGVTQKSAQVMELTLDNGEVIICTPEHTFPIVGKGKVKAKDILVNTDSLISFTTRLYSINEKDNASDPQYHQYFEHTANKWTFTHRKVANFFKATNLHNELVYDQSIVGDKKVIHHVDFDKYNNKPCNLWFMNGYDHFLLHSKEYGKYYQTLSADEKQLISDKKRNTIAAKSADEKAVSYSKISDGNKLAWKRMKLDTPRFARRTAQLLPNLTFSDKPWQNQTLKITDRMHVILVEITKHAALTKQIASELLNNNAEFMDIYNKLNSPEEKKICKVSQHVSKSALDNIVIQCGYTSWIDFLKRHGHSTIRPSTKLKWNDAMLKILVDSVNSDNIMYKTTAYLSITANAAFLSIFKQLNPKVAKFSNNTFSVFLSDMGFGSWNAFMTQKENFNHKVVSIRLLADYQEVGTLTIDGNEKHHNFHTFAIEQGVYAYNSNVIDSSYNTMCLDLSTMIPLLDGRTLQLSEIISEFEQGKENWVYSCDPITGEVMPGIVDWAGITRKNTETIKITLDNDEVLICTPDHKIPVLGKGFVEAKDLTPADSLIAFNTQDKPISSGKTNKYQQIWDHKTKTWLWTHRMVGEFFRKKESTYLPTHIQYDGAYLNAQIKLTEEVHDCKIKTIEVVSNRDVGTLTVDGNEKWHSHHTFAIASGIFVKNSMSEDYFFPKTCCSLTTKVKLLNDKSLTIQELIEDYENGIENFTYTVNQKTHAIEVGKIVWAGVTRKNAQVVEVTLDSGKSVKVTPDHRFIMRDGSEVEAQHLKEGDSLMPMGNTNNHKVQAVTWLTDIEDTGDITIESASGHHNFSLDIGVFIHNSEGRGSDVTTLPGGSNIGEIDDLKYFTNKLFRGLRIPSSYLPTGADDSQASFNDGRVGTAYIQELRFNKYCERLQSLMTMRFDEEFKMYIYSRGLNIDINLFELEFNPPMNFASSRQISLDSERINTFNTIQAVPYMSKRFALKRFLGLTDEEIAENERSWGEEQGKGEPTHTDAAGELRSAGLSAAGIAGDFGAAGDMTAPDDLGLEGDMPAEPGAAPVPAAPMPAAV